MELDLYIRNGCQLIGLLSYNLAAQVSIQNPPIAHSLVFA